MTEISRHFISLHIMLSLNFSCHSMCGTSWSLRQLFLISRQLKYYSTYICIDGEDVFLEMHLKPASIKSFCLFHGCFQGLFGKWQTVKWTWIEIETLSVTRMDRETNHQPLILKCQEGLFPDNGSLRLEIQLRSRIADIRFSC